MQSIKEVNPSNQSNPSNQITEVSHCLPADPQSQKGVKLMLTINPEVPDQVEEFEAIAATSPQSIQEFLIRLNELQKQKAKNNK